MALWKAGMMWESEVVQGPSLAWDLVVSPDHPPGVPSILLPFSIFGTAGVSRKRIWEVVMWEWVWMCIT